MIKVSLVKSRLYSFFSGTIIIIKVTASDYTKLGFFRSVFMIFFQNFQIKKIYINIYKNPGKTQTCYLYTYNFKPPQLSLY